MSSIIQYYTILMTENIITSDDINYLHDTIMNSTEYDFLLPINEVNGVKCRVNIRSVHKIENTKPEPLYILSIENMNDMIAYQESMSKQMYIYKNPLLMNVIEHFINVLPKLQLTIDGDFSAE